MRIALDSDGYTDLFNEVRETVAVVEHAEAVLLPFAVVGELRAGFTWGNRQAENERTLQRFLQRDGVSVLFPDDQTTYQYAAIYRQLRKQGTPIPINDMWVAALALQHNLTLHTRDRHFDHLPQIMRI